MTASTMPQGADSPTSPDPFVVRTATDHWRVEPDLNRVHAASGAVQQLEPRVMQVLVELAGQAGEVVPREDLLARVWSDVVVNEEALTRAVSEVRKAFGDSAQAPEVVETIRGTGYRFIATVEPVADKDKTEVATAEARDVRLGSGLRRSVLVGGLAVLVVALVAAAVVWAAPWQSASSAPTLLETQPFTSYPGRERMPALSPDGSRVAFAWTGTEGDDYDLYLKQENTGDPLRLTTDPAFEAFPAWSPDGTTLAFVRMTDSTGALFTVPALGGPARKLIDVRSFVLGLDWSPDGAALLFAERPAPDAPYRVMRLDLATRDTTALTQPPPSAYGDLFPRWAPDGQTVAFARRARVGGQDLYLVRADGTNERTLTQGELSIRGLDWTPDGERLVYASYQSGTFGLWQVAVATGAVTWLPTRAERIYNPSVADQTGALVYEELTYEKDIWQIDLNGSGEGEPPSRPIITSTRWDCEAYYSPDGTRLVFTSSRSGTLELWLSAADGANPVQLTDVGGAFVGNPRWSPDGERIAFYATPEGQAEVFVMDVEGSTPRRLRLDDRTDANYWVTAWSRDGQWIYAASDRSGTWQLWKLRPDGSDLSPVTVDGGFAAHESVTGDTLFYTKRTAPGIWMQPTEGGPERQVVEDLNLADWGNWDVTAEGLYFIRRTAEGTTIAFQGFGEGEVRTVATIPNIASPSLEVSPDGRRILYARIEQSDSDLILTHLGE